MMYLFHLKGRIVKGSADARELKGKLELEIIALRREFISIIIQSLFCFLFVD